MMMSSDLGAAGGDAPSITHIDLTDNTYNDGLTASSAPKRNRRKRARPNAISNASNRRPASSFTTVSVAPSYGIRLGSGNAEHWFKARQGCVKRWLRATSKPPSSAINQKVAVLRYTEDEYESLFKSESWTKEETDQMLNLVEQFDERFIIVADRIQPSRTVEEIKQRFYEIQNALAQSRNPEENLPAVSYNADQEKTRREQLELLFKRTPEEEKQMAQLVLDNAQLEHTIRSRKRELSESRRLVKVQKAISRMSNAVTEGVVKRRSTRPPTEEEQRQNPFSGLPDHVVIGNAFPNRSSGVYLRHQQLLTAPSLVNQRLQKQLETELEDAGLSVSQLPTPTAAVCDMYDRLRQDFLSLFNLQRYVSRKEQDTLQLKHDLQAAQKAAGITPSSKSKKKPVPGGGTPTTKKIVASKAPVSRSIAAASPITPSAMDVDLIPHHTGSMEPR